MRGRYYLATCYETDRKNIFDYFEFKKGETYLMHEYDSRCCFHGDGTPHRETDIIIYTPIVNMSLRINYENRNMFHEIKIEQKDFKLDTNCKGVVFTNLYDNKVIPTNNKSDYVITYRNKYVAHTKTKKDALNYIDKLINENTLILD